MSRTLLYYPSFQLPSSSWLKTSLLYWDEVGSIVPSRMERVLETPDLKYLSDEGIYKRFDPGPYFYDAQQSGSFIDQFIQRLEAPEFEQEMTRPNSGQYWHLAFEKMNYSVWTELANRNLTPDRVDGDGWIRVKKPAAIIYMGLLAKALATSNAEYVQPSTDRIDYENIIYRCSASQTPLPGIAVSLKGLLPIVSADVPLQSIIQFKRKHFDELLRLRQTVDECQTKIEDAKSEDAAKLLLTQFKEQYQLASSDIDRVMKERGIRYTVGTMRAILGAKPTAWLGSVVGALAGSPSLNPVVIASTAVAGFVAGGSIEVASYMLDARDKERSLLASPFSYLYSAEKSHIT